MTVSELVQTLTKCSTAQANHAESMICQSPEVLGLLALRCGLGVSMVGAGGVLLVGTGGAAGVVGGVTLGYAGVTQARKYCNALIHHSTAKMKSNPALRFKPLLD